MRVLNFLIITWNTFHAWVDSLERRIYYRKASIWSFIFYGTFAVTVCISIREHGVLPAIGYGVLSAFIVGSCIMDLVRIFPFALRMLFLGLIVTFIWVLCFLVFG